MPIGIVSDESFELELNQNQQPRGKVISIEKGRGSVTNVPPSLRSVIAEEKINGATAEELNKEFGISKSQISAYAHGAVSTATYHTPDPQLSKSNNNTIE